MSLIVTQLNADTTFLVHFLPTSDPPENPPTSQSHLPGTFTILFDPWLTGASSIWNPRFQISHHTSSPAVTSLAQLPRQPDVIIISQDKPDHCHRETLCTLPAESRVRVLATPAAARKIRDWKYFTHARIEALQEYSAAKEGSVLRIPVPAEDGGGGAPGEVTVCYVPQRADVTKLHNAISVTYRAPTGSVAATGSEVGLSSSRDSSPSPSTTPETTSCARSVDGARATSPPEKTASPEPRDDTLLSILYTPHGISARTLQPLLTYLTRLSALPLTALFHSLTLEHNPWFLGGVVANGYPGGAEIVRMFGVRYWVSAHDEVKDNRGWSVALIQSRVWAVGEAQGMLEQEGRGRGTRVVEVGNGGRLVCR